MESKFNKLIISGVQICRIDKWSLQSQMLANIQEERICIQLKIVKKEISVKLKIGQKYVTNHHNPYSTRRAD